MIKPLTSMRSMRLMLPIYGLLALAVIGPGLLPGYLLTFDMSWTPMFPLTSTNVAPLYGLFHILSLILPGWLVQKLFLLGLFTVMGLGAHRLTRRLVASPAWTAYFAGLIYVINPFSYSRFVSGQFLVLCGYALLPWFIASFIELLKRPRWQQALRVLGWAAAIGWTSIHAVGIAALAAAVLMAAGFIGDRTVRARWRGIIGWTLAAAGGWIVANLWWVLPAATGTSRTGAQIRDFGASQYEAFATSSDPAWGVLTNALGLYGFWADSQGRYLLPKQIYGEAWVLWFVPLLALGILGLWKLRRSPWAWALLVLGDFGLILGLGIAWGPTAPLSRWLIEHVPLYAGYREPAKWLALRCVEYAVLGAAGVAWLAERRQAVWRYAAAGALAIPLLYTPTMLWGAAGQLRASDYPAGWYAFEQRLKAEGGVGKVVAFPWHQYLELNFAHGRTVGNPAAGFFYSRPVVSGNNFELAGVTDGMRSPAQQLIEDQLLPQRRTVRDAGRLLATQNVEYVMLFTTSDYERYQWLDAQTDLKLDYTGEGIRVYKNLAYRSVTK